MTMDDDTDAIDEDTTAKFNELLQHWAAKDHLIAIANGITSKSAFNQFINSLPNVEQLDNFRSLLPKIDKTIHSKLWNDFQKQTSTSANDWLLKLSQSKLIKEI